MGCHHVCVVFILVFLSCIILFLCLRLKPCQNCYFFKFNDYLLMWRSWKGHIIDISILFAPNQQILIEISINFFYPCTVAAWRVNCVVKYSHYNWSGSPCGWSPHQRMVIIFSKELEMRRKCFFCIFAKKKYLRKCDDNKPRCFAKKGF